MEEGLRETKNSAFGLATEQRKAISLFISATKN